MAGSGWMERLNVKFVSLYELEQLHAKFNTRDAQEQNRSVSTVFRVELLKSPGPDTGLLPALASTPIRRSRQNTSFRRWLLNALCHRLGQIGSRHGRVIWAAIPPFNETPLTSIPYVWCMTLCFIPDASINDIVMPGQMERFPALLREMLAPAAPAHQLPAGYLFWSATEPAYGSILIDPIDPEIVAAHRQMFQEVPMTTAPQDPPQAPQEIMQENPQ